MYDHSEEYLLFSTSEDSLDCDDVREKRRWCARHDLKETIDKDYCECGMPLETVRESEAPLKERSERV